MSLCKVRAIVTLDGVKTNPIKSMPKNEIESQSFKRVAEDFRMALFSNIDGADIRILESVENDMGVKKKEFGRNVPRFHVHVYKVEGEMVEVDWLDANIPPAEARDLAIEAVKLGENVNLPVKSDCEFVAVSFRIEE